MSIRSCAKRIPYAVGVYRYAAALNRKRLNRKALDPLKNRSVPQGRNIREALLSLQRTLPKSAREWVGRIESERERLLGCEGPLNDGSLGEGGPYDVDVSIRQACFASKPARPALLLFLLTRTVRPVNVIELGTNVGVSSAYIGAALKAGGQNGTVTTLEASAYRQHLAGDVHRRLGLDNTSYVQGLFADTLRQTLASLGSVDLAFIDGHHQYQPTLDYFDEIMRFSTPDTVFIFDDIRWSEGMKRAWSRIQSDERLGLIVDLVTVGICTRRCRDDVQRIVTDPIHLF